MHNFSKKSSSTTRAKPVQVIIRNVRNRSLTPLKPLCESPHSTQSFTENYSFTPDCLKFHSITPQYRGKMVDWMAEVTKTFQCSTRTFFSSVKIMDKFFQLQHISIHPSLLHIIGVVCMLIASKFEDIHAISLNDAKSRISHNKFSSEDIRTTEQAVLKKLGFAVNFVTRVDLIEDTVEEIGAGKDVLETSLFFAKISMHCYTHLQFTESQAAFWCILMTAKALDREEVAFKVTEKFGKNTGVKHYEEFANDVKMFRQNFPSFRSVFFTSEVDFEAVTCKVFKTPQ